MHISCQFSGDFGTAGTCGHGVMEYWSDGAKFEKVKNCVFLEAHFVKTCYISLL
jgi:hypothetical protein